MPVYMYVYIHVHVCNCLSMTFFQPINPDFTPQVYQVYTVDAVASQGSRTTES